jgi:serine/threonine protein kinase
MISILIFPLAIEEMGNCCCNMRSECQAERYHLEKVVGKGTYGKVYAATDLKTQKKVAVKIIKDQYVEAVEKSLGDGSLQLAHKNVVAVMGSFQTKATLYLVMEYCEGGDLFDLAEAHKMRVEERKVAQVAKQILEGLSYLHQKRVAHCDIKLSNIMFANDTAKIIDFGMAQFIRDQVLLTKYVGSINYMAPEIFAGAYNEQIDIWALGCVVFALLIGYLPFNPTLTRSMGTIMKEITRGFNASIHEGHGAWFPEERPISEGARSFIAGLLVSDWHSRLTAREALQHHWLAENEFNES